MTTNIPNKLLLMLVLVSGIVIGILLSPILHSTKQPKTPQLIRPDHNTSEDTHTITTANDNTLKTEFIPASTTANSSKATDHIDRLINEKRFEAVEIPSGCLMPAVLDMFSSQDCIKEQNDESYFDEITISQPECLKYLQAAIQDKGPNHASPWLVDLAIIYTQCQDKPQAAKLCVNHIPFRVRDPYSYRRKCAKLLLETNQRQEAIAALTIEDQVTTDDTGFAYSQIDLATILLESSKEQALDVLRSSIQKLPHKSNSRSLLVEEIQKLQKNPSSIPK